MQRYPPPLIGLKFRTRSSTKPPVCCCWVYECSLPSRRGCATSSTARMRKIHPHSAPPYHGKEDVRAIECTSNLG
eukprot:1141185-Pelagomonas_calceolata.AAC.3